jgi:hypothetical protein
MIKELKEEKRKEEREEKKGREEKCYNLCCFMSLKFRHSLQQRELTDLYKSFKYK